MTRSTIHSASLLVALAVASAAGSAGAQGITDAYSMRESDEPYAPLDLAEATTLFTSGDDGFAEVSLPFTFRFYGREYTKVYVSANGVVTFLGRDATTGQLQPISGANVAVPALGTPQATIAAAWDDWNVSPGAPGGGGAVAWQLLGDAPARVLVVDWQRVQPFSASGANHPTASFQLRLSEGTDEYEVRFLAPEPEAPVPAISFTSGSENHLGTLGLPHNGCSPTCTIADFAAGTVVFPNLNPELSVDLALGGAANGGPVALVTLRNGGKSSATAPWHLYVSTDATLDAGDRRVAEETVTLAAETGRIDRTIEVPIPAAEKGRRFLIAAIDPADAIAELNNRNNFAVLQPAFIAGVDVVATIAGQRAAVAGERASVTVRLTNLGTRDATGLRIQLDVSSEDGEVDREPVYLGDPVSIGALATNELALIFDVPADLPAGPYLVNFLLDPGSLLDEADRSNNRTDAPLAIELRGPDVAVTSVAAGTFRVPKGALLPVRVLLSNDGLARASAFRFSVYLSDNDVITRADRRIYDSQPVSLAGGEQRSVTESARVPETVPTGRYYVGVILDAEGVVLEQNLANNIRSAFDQVTIVEPVSDPAVLSLETSSAGVAGEAIRLSAVLANLGTAAVTTRYGVYASSNALLSTNDVLLGEAPLTLGAGAQAKIARDVLLPPSLPAGTWWIGLIADPDRAIPDSDRQNDIGIAAPITVEAPAFVVTTTSLPPASVGFAYDVRLAARGGAGVTTWAIVGGELPSGITLDASGRLSGTPLVAGVKAFILEARSAGARATRAATLSVRVPASSLGLLPGSLPTARVGKPYSQEIAAEGGLPPYRFTVASGTLPAGLSLTEQGVLAGLPAVAGAVDLRVRVEDAVANSAEGLVSVRVSAEGVLALIPGRLRDAEVGRAYSTSLPIEGGKAPFAVSLASGALPAGVAATVDGTNVKISGTPTAKGLDAFTLAVTDANGDRDDAHFVLRTAERALTFLVGTPPPALRGEPYTLAIEATLKGTGTFTLVDGTLPSGLELTPDGKIVGTVARDAAARLHAVAIHAVDSGGGEGTVALAIEVPAPPVTPVSDGGCSTLPGSSGLLLAFVAFGLLLRRRARAFAVGVAGLALFAGGSASAQYRVTRATETFVPLDPAASDLVFDATATATSKAVTLPFSFVFFGSTQSVVGLSKYGLLTFAGTSESATNVAIPAPSDPSNFIAPFWDTLKLSPETPDLPSTMRTAVLGTAPARRFVAEWRNIQKNSTSEDGAEYAAFSFQVVLFEGTNAIEVRYGGRGALLGRTPVLAGSMGLEGPGGLVGVDLSDRSCSPSCTAADIPVNGVVQVSLAANLSIAWTQSPEFLFANLAESVRVAVTNKGGAEAKNVKVRVLLSADALADDTDAVVGSSSPVTLFPGATATITTRITAPTTGPQGIAYLIAQVDPASEIVEIDEDDNETPSVAVSVSPPAPDFVSTRLIAGTLLRPGVAFPLARTIRNVGNAPGAATFRVVLSDNAVVSDADLTLESGAVPATGTLAADGTFDQTTDVTLPADIAPGRYWLGLVVRPVAGSDELDALNNDRVFGPVDVAAGALSIATTELEPASAGLPFSRQLRAGGGVGEYSWSAGTPGVPAGVTLTPEGQLAGLLATSGEWPIEVRVASGGATVVKTFVLRVTGGGLALTVLSPRLPLGMIGRPYAANLAAQGGKPPYTWRLASGAELPEGLALDAAGRIEGTTFDDGRATFAVTVKDAAGAEASGDVLLPIAGPERPLFATLSLPQGRVGAAFSAQLEAAGGVPPYRFSVTESRQVPLQAGSEGRSFIGALPPGLELSEAGVITGNPELVGAFVVLLRVVDAQAIEEAASYVLEITAESAPEVTTATLPDAVVPDPYQATLAATGFTGAVAWEILLPEGETLPPGLAFGSEGRIFGTALAEKKVAFLAVARDVSGNVATRVLAIRSVAKPPPPAEGGCSQAGGGSLLLLLLLGLGLLLARRRAGLAGAGLVAALGVGCSSTPTTEVTCATPCAAPFVCDTRDGLCKCGAAGGAICGDGETCDAASKSCLVATCTGGCPGGTACGRDGACHCGGVEGPTCATGQRCTLGRCEAQDVCEGVTCAEGLTCSPSAGGACRCGPGGPACAPGERCVDATCKPDLCHGVGCTGGTTCDPTDGVCKCGGQGGSACRGGEACDAASASCKRSTLCDAATCPTGTLCDPSDGRCRCGSSTGPVCGAGQTCEPVAAKCAGGDLCGGVTCTNGQSCDPEDGVCKCGGYGGLACETGEICVRQGTADRCETPCEPLVPSCAGGRTCRYDVASGKSFCVLIGVAREGETCSGNDCAADLHCLVAPGAPSGFCREYCQSTMACGGDEACTYFSALPGRLGVCLESP